jgi:CHASE3 domain sensor protein
MELSGCINVRAHTRMRSREDIIDEFIMICISIVAYVLISFAYLACSNVYRELDHLREENKKLHKILKDISQAHFANTFADPKNH